MDGNSSDFPDDEQVCANCGDSIEIGSWHPVLAETDASGVFHLHPFCSPYCRDVWHRTQTTQNQE